MSVKISVIVPVYNVEKYLRECLDSITAQNYDNYEVICVNDGSTDKSLEILDEYALKYEYIRVVSKDNGGLSSARNCGIEKATGDYLYFLDSDDMLADENVLSDMAYYVQKDDLDILYMDGRSFYESEELNKKSPGYEKAYTSVCDYGIYETGLELFAVFAKHHDFRVQACMQCIKKEFIDRYSLRYLEGIIYEDNLFFFKSIISADKVRHIKRVVMHRRVREGSIMQSPMNINSLRSLLYIYIDCINILDIYNEQYDKYQEEIRTYIEQFKKQLRSMYFYKLEQAERNKIVHLTLKERMILNSIIKEVDYIFPHHMIKEENDIAIDGAGDVGTEYYYQAAKSGRYGSIYVVDKKGEEASTQYMKVIEPKKLVDIRVDNIIIAIKSENIAMEVKEELLLLGVDKDKIIWDVR